MTDPVQFLDLDDVLELAVRLLGSPAPIRDIGLLGSAVARPQTSLFGQRCQCGPGRQRRCLRPRARHRRQQPRVRTHCQRSGTTLHQATTAPSIDVEQRLIDVSGGCGWVLCDAEEIALGIGQCGPFHPRVVVQHLPLEGCTQRGESFNFVCPRSPRHGEVEMLCLLFGTCIAPRREEHRESAGLTVRHVREIGRRSLDNAAQHFGPESSQRGRVIRIDVDCSEGDRSVRRMLHDCAAFRVDRGSHHVAKAGPRSDWRCAHRPGNLLQ